MLLEMVNIVRLTNIVNVVKCAKIVLAANKTEVLLVYVLQGWRFAWNFGIRFVKNPVNLTEIVDGTLENIVTKRKESVRDFLANKHIKKTDFAHINHCYILTNHITMIGVKELGLILIFVSYSLGAGKYCSVDQDCAQNEVCSGVAEDGDVAVKICMKSKMQRFVGSLLDQVFPKNPCKSHTDCKWYLGMYCDKKIGFCETKIL